MVRVQYMSGIVRTRGLVTSPGSRQADVRPFPPTLARGGASVVVESPSFPPTLKGSGSRRLGVHGPTGIRTQGILLAKEALYR